MSNYSYVAIDLRGAETRGTLAVSDQAEALRRIKEMGLFPTQVLETHESRFRGFHRPLKPSLARRGINLSIAGLGAAVKPRTLSVFTRQLATLVEAGMPLLRGLRTLQEQEQSPAMRRVIVSIAEAIENGSSLTEAVGALPRVFSRLYVSMVKAGEIGGALEVTLRRLAEFLEHAIQIKGKVKAALLYPCSVLFVALGILVLMMSFVVPRFKVVFQSLMNGMPLPGFTLLILNVSEAVKNHLPLAVTSVVVLSVGFLLLLRTTWGRWSFDRFKLVMPLIGPVFRKAAISRFSRTLGTLISSGVPILRALTIVKETAGNLVLAQVIGAVQNHVKEGDPIAPSLRASSVFPVMIAGMVDVGEQTGALPEMLMKIADIYDGEVDHAVSAMTSLLEPIMIVLLAVMVGSIVIALFLPLLTIMERGFDGSNSDAAD